MALIPLKQTVTVTSPASIDGWGEEVSGAAQVHKARVESDTRVVTNQHGNEAVTSLRIIFDKLPDISYNHAITYTNELGATVTRTPIRIEVKRGLNGKALLTEVYV